MTQVTVDEPAAGRGLGEVVSSFLKLGFLAFGGPAAHVAIFEDEFVRRRKWIDQQHFLDLLGAANLIPGPNSTEMAIHIGYTRAGWPGLILAGACFTLPAMLIVLGISWFYTQYGELPEIEALLVGIKPVMIAIVLQALISLGKTALKSRLHVVIAIAALGASFTGIHPLFILFIGAGIFFTAIRLKEKNGQIRKLAFLPLAISPGLLLSSVPFSFSVLFLTFLKIGAVLYGSGYVLLAYLQADFVQRLGWLSERQLLDAVAIGQITPGPLFTAATFIGYLVGGLPGGLLATLGIFLPSFVFVAISNPLIPRFRNSKPLSILLDGINVTSLGLMGAVAIVLGRTALVDPFTVVMFALSAWLLYRYRLNSTWLIIGGAVAGLLRMIIL